ncbi:MAG: VWA domain-containing protein [Halioglobus sp.]
MIPDWSQLHLMRPEWLWALLPAVFLAILLWRARSRSGGWSDVIAPELLPYLVGKHVASRGPNLLPFVLLGWILAALAASGPSWEKIPQPVLQKQDAMVLVLDLSHSMNAGDLAPSRLDRARQKLLDLLQRRNEGQTGLIAYAGDAHIVTPLTDDNPTIANLLPVLSPDMMPLPGSNTASAISQAVDLLHSAGISQGQIVLVTDGVDKEARGRVVEIIKDSGMQLSVLAVGTATGAPIPLPRGGFLKDNRGTIVIPTLDQSALQAMASAAGGRYLNIQIGDKDLDQLLSGSLIPNQETTLTLDRTADTWDDKGYLLALMLLPLILPLFRRGWLACLLPLMLLSSPESAQAQSWKDLWLTPDQQGQQALQQGDPKAAAELFESKDWAGTAAYEGEEFESAAKHFSAGDTADDWYNRGNALAKAGQLDEAIEAYQESLARQPDQVDATENIELLEQMKQEQEQQQQDGEGEEEQDNEDQQQDDQEKSESQGDSDPSDQPQDGDSDSSDPQDPQDQQDPPESDQPQDPSEEEQTEDPSEQPGEQEEPEEQQADADAAQAEEASPEDQEEDQAMQQWLRRIPDDPSGLLREKFRYESRQRQEQGDGQKNETYW